MTLFSSQFVATDRVEVKKKNKNTKLSVSFLSFFDNGIVIALMRRLQQRAPLRCGTLALSWRTVISGQMPTEGSGPGSNPQGWELRRGHHLQSSVGLHSPIRTACGREFNPQVYYEVLQACCDQQWLVAIQRELRTDTEYVNYLRQHGGAAKDVRMLTESVQHDDEFMAKLKEKLKTDEKMSLTLCAVQESYERIRKKRDQHETQVAADGGRDPYASMKAKQKGEFGSQMPQF